MPFEKYNDCHNISRFLKQHIYIFILLISLSVYIIVWSEISLDRLYTLNVLWDDLGISIEQLWLPLHNNWGVLEYLYVFFTEGLTLLLSPLIIPGSIQLILIIQTVAIGGVSLPIFGIAVHFTKDKRIALFVSELYLIYFPISGLNWYDFHVEAFFPILFVLGYFLYLRKRERLSLIMFFLSGIVAYPYAVFIFITSIIIFSEHIPEIKRNGLKIIFKNAQFPLALFLISIFLLGGSFLLNGGLAYTQASVHYSGVVNKSYEAGVLTFLYVFLPLSFFPLLSKKWIFTYIPYFVVTVFVGGFGLDIPTAFHYQAPVLIAPFAFLGFIDFISALSKMERCNIVHKKKTLKKLFAKRNQVLVVISVFLTISTAVLFEPYSPVNKYTYDNFNTFGNYVDGNTSAYGYLSDVLSLIPKGNNSVLIQGNLPEIYPRPEPIATFPNSDPVLIAGDLSNLHFSPNLTLNNFKNNSYTISVYSGIPYNEYYYNISIYYALAYTDSPWYYAGPPSMQYFIHMMNESGTYGVVADYHGFLLMEWGYSGPLLLKNYSV